MLLKIYVQVRSSNLQVTQIANIDQLLFLAVRGFLEQSLRSEDQNSVTRY